MRKLYPLQAGARRKRASRRGRKGFLFFLLLVLVIFLGNHLWSESSLKEHILRTQYPIKYQGFVEKYAEKFSLEKELVYALIRTESKFDPYAVSRTDARGLMQIQSETAMDCARELKWSHFSVDDLFDPEINIHLGCYYFSKLLKHYNGRRNVAIAAYNGGPGNIEKWLKDDAYTNEKGELINIPFPETKNYIVRVNDACEKYRSLYPLPEAKGVFK